MRGTRRLLCAAGAGRFAGKRAVVAGVADDKVSSHRSASATYISALQGYGWAIAQMLLHEGVSDLMLAT